MVKAGVARLIIATLVYIELFWSLLGGQYQRRVVQNDATATGIWYGDGAITVRFMTVKNEESQQASDRRDLVQRLFAVAISIGIGSRLVSVDGPGWIKELRMPRGLEEWEHLFVLLLALYATVLSWDGYLASVRSKPLNDWLRFAIDVFLVIIYMILISTSNQTWHWLTILCIIFALYVIWDSASIWHYPRTFDRDFVDGSSRLLTIFRVYGLSVLDRPNIDRGPLISLAWGAYFAALWWTVWRLYSYPYFSVFWLLLAAVVGLSLYRRDKRRIGADGARGFKMWQRALIIIGLVCCVILLGHVSIKL